MHKFSIAVVTIVCINTISCTKPTQPGVPGGTNEVAQVRRIEWSDGIVAVMNYNVDLTLSSIDYTYQGQTGSTFFSWNNSRLKEMYDGSSIYKNNFFFNGNRLTHYINSAATGASNSSYHLQYEYDGSGGLARLNYFTSNELGTELKAASTYHYHSSGDLATVTTTMDNSLITHVVETFSQEVAFNPLIFMETTLSEYYTIYNYPLLSSWNKLPARVTRKFKPANNQEYVDKITVNDFEIANNRINKITTTTTVPGMPQYSKQVTATFYY